MPLTPPYARLAAAAPALRAALAEWFAGAARDLPWRRERTPYAVVVSELMLQQTQVETVKPYFERWQARFPDFAALAAAGEAEVLAAWAGLGYYARARRLHALAREVVRGGLPAGYDAWLALPGVGPYTAAAVASLAQGEPVAVADGNVARVLTRLAGDGRAFASSTAAAQAVRPAAQALLDPSAPGRHNEAVMELGALVCRPRAPLCLLCPLGRWCAARGADPEAIPAIARAAVTETHLDRWWIERAGAVVLQRYPDGRRRLAGMVELPRADALPGADPAVAEVTGVIRRTIARERFTETVRRWPATTPQPPLPPGLFWAAPSEWPALPLTGPHRKFLRGRAPAG